MKKYLGRRELCEKNSFDARLEQLPAMKEEKEKIRCLRCDSSFIKEEVQLPNGGFYCPACIQLGRVDTGKCFQRAVQKRKRPKEAVFSWKGKLSPIQKEGAKKVLQAVKKGEALLLWAVTGSGKTEMLFKGIHFALSQGMRVGIATPRIDVCRELYPRLQAVFRDAEILLLYGGSEEKYRYAPLTICTTHQLMRFYRAFDFLIIDEIDAFPYANDPKLAFAARNARSRKGSLVYLTATPSKKLLKEMAGAFDICRIPARYHRRPLPEPQLVWWNKWQIKARSGKGLLPLVQTVKRLVQKNHLLIFCPSIELMEELEGHLQKRMKELRIQAVSSQTDEREAIVQQMREQEVDVLLTTTILERGVTFEQVSVIVLGADHRVYNKATLVQIAGRVDRKGEYSQGEVLFFYDEMTQDIRQACREIRKMNQLAGKRGLIDEV